MEITMPPTAKEKKHIGRAPNYSPEYYMMMDKQMVDDGITYREAARIYGVSHGTVCHWLKLYKSGKLVGHLNKGKQNQNYKDENAQFRTERHIKELKHEIAELYLENTMLKKALAYSQRIKREDSSVITSENLDQFQEPVK